MPETWVRGNFFQQALDYVKRRRGMDGLDMIGVYHDQYLPEQRYPFVDFCTLLSIIYTTIGDGTYSDVSKLGKDILINDDRWRLLFKDKDPKDVFTTTKRQEDRYMVGDFDVKSVEHRKITLTMTMWSGKKEHQEIWAEFYKGRLEGVLELTGYEGTVGVKKGKKGIYNYTIKWEL